ncbi:MAG: amidohydrolase, partial [Clostridia bacterium]|nr:amidohydrolase [Clostridia bacterium]
AVLLAVAEMLHSCRDRFRGTARLLFQTGEETATGALNMLREGALEGVDAILCMHVASMDEKGFRTGNIAAVPGPVSSFKDKFIIRVKGKGAHGAYPHKGIDPIAVAARIHIAFDELCAREIRTDIPAVLTVGSFVAGEDHNTIPETAEMKGSIRTQDEAVSEFLLRRMREICEYTAKAFGAEAEFVHIKGSRAVFNDPALCQVLWRAVKKEWGEDRLLTAYSAPRMGSDDFANYASKVPGVYFHLQTANPEKGIFGGGHTPRFHLDEDALLGGLVTYVATALEYLA